VDVRYEIICDEGSGDIAGSRNCNQDSRANNQTDAPPTSEPEPTVTDTTLDPTIGDSVTPSTSTEEVTPTESITEPPAQGFTCPGTGVYADPQDCRSYYRCDTITEPKHSTCIILTKFDPAKSGCSFGLC
jgi:hypothetical protein